MNITARSYLTAGIAAVGAGAIALSPVQPLPTHLAIAPERVVSDLTVSLASTIDPITPWVDTFKLSAQNITKLVQFYLEKPFPLIQTISANIVTYAQELPDLGQILNQMWGNFQTFFQAPWSPGACAEDPCSDPAIYAGDFISNVPITNKVPFLGKLSQRQVYETLPGVLQAADPDLLTKLAPLLAFAGNHYSGQLAGLIGPLVAPLIVLTRSFTAIGQFFQDGDVIGAINEFINIPANVTNGVLNGAGYLDLTGVVNAIQPLPSSIKSIGLNLGGIISPPVPFEGTLEEPTAINGGTLFDNIAAEAEVLGLSVTTPGIPVSWFGSVIGLGQFLSEAMLVPRPPAPTTAATAKAVAAVPAPAASAPAEAPAAVEVQAAVEAPEAPEVKTLVAPPADAPAAVDIDVPKQVSAGNGDTDAPAPTGKVRRGSAAGGGNGGAHTGARGHRGDNN